VTDEDELRAAAESGDPKAMTELGVHLYHDDEMDEAAEWFHKAADLGEAEAMAGLGDYYDFEGDEAEAERWYRRAAELGDASAIANLEALVALRKG
jgi:TPR repeat protein